MDFVDEDDVLPTDTVCGHCMRYVACPHQGYMCKTRMGHDTSGVVCVYGPSARAMSCKDAWGAVLEWLDDLDAVPEDELPSLASACLEIDEARRERVGEEEEEEEEGAAAGEEGSGCATGPFIHPNDYFTMEHVCKLTGWGEEYGEEAEIAMINVLFTAEENRRERLAQDAKRAAWRRERHHQQLQEKRKRSAVDATQEAQERVKRVRFQLAA